MAVPSAVRLAVADFAFGIVSTELAPADDAESGRARLPAANRVFFPEDANLRIDCEERAASMLRREEAGAMPTLLPADH
jgi:hypothetical protein